MRREPAPWRDLVLVCGKCMKKHDRESLRGELKRALKDSGAKHVRVVATGCLDLCPKDGVALTTLAGLSSQPPWLWVMGADEPAAPAAVKLLELAPAP